MVGLLSGILDSFSAAINIAAVINNAIQGAKANKIAQKQADAAQDQVNISQQQLDLQKQASYLNGLNSIRDYEKSIADLEASKAQYEIDIRDTTSQITSYGLWLKNYKNQYAQEVASKQAQTDQLMASGKEAYENFMNAIGYSDAQAGATGRAGAGTSQAKITGALDKKLVDYVGADRTLDAYGGLYGSQLTAADLEMGQLKTDLDLQWQEMDRNRTIAEETLADYEKSIAMTNQSIANSTKAKNDLQEFLELNFGEYSNSSHIGLSGAGVDFYSKINGDETPYAVSHGQSTRTFIKG